MIDAIIDTDPGIDDALAILLALKSGRFRVHTMTTVAGNSPIEDTTANAEFLLALAGRDHIPLYSGARKPLQRDLVTAPQYTERADWPGLDGEAPPTSPTTGRPGSWRSSESPDIRSR